MRRVPENAAIVTAAAMRAAEAEVFAGGVSQDELMERAGAAIAVQVARLAAGRAILVLAGPGNNGGDAHVVARLLAEWDHDVIVAADGEMGDGSAARMRGLWRGGTVSVDDAPRRQVVVDGLFGIGLTRPLESHLQRQLAHIVAAADLVIAIDVPSGIGADDGAELGCASADVTIALGALKPAHLLGAGIGTCGHLLLADIGVEVSQAWRTLARPIIPTPAADSHKFTRGMVAVLSGDMPGAASLAARAAMRGGAGYVVLADSDSGGPDALVRCPIDDALFEDDRIGAMLIGPGLGRSHNAAALLDRALASDRPLVIDGDALSLLGTTAATRLRDRPAILTPHAGEFARMFGEGQGSKIDRTLAAATRSNCTIVHKGADTVIARPDGSVTVSAAAPPWLASAGTGDVLAGLVASRLAAGARDPAGEAAWLHSRAAALAGPALIADDLIDALPRAIADCL